MSYIKRGKCVLVTVLLAVSSIAAAVDYKSVYDAGDSFSGAIIAMRNGLKIVEIPADEKTDKNQIAAEIVRRLVQDYPMQTDWMLQDYGTEFHRWFVSEDSTADYQRMSKAVLGREADIKSSADEAAWLDLYLKACEKRRQIRLAPMRARDQRIVFTKHFNMGGSHYAYTEGQSDAQAERSFRAGTSLCILETDGSVTTLIEDPKGVIRDPDVSFDAKRILFSWKKSDREDDYHLYEMDVASGKIKQITSGLGFADYEAVYLPDGDIIFNSTRCVQIVDCWWTEVSNLYRCDKDGRFLRRLTFDQVHTNFPTVLADGRVIYTRWDYNDRGQIYPQPLYQMNPDGTTQSEYYGNNSWFPTTILHARGVPGTKKVVAIATGHHSRQTGKLILIDAAMGRQENSGVTLVAPIRETKADRIDSYGQNGELFQYPFSFNESEYLVTYSPLGWGGRDAHFGVYYMTIDGTRELLVSDRKISCNQSIPLAPRPIPHLRPRVADYQKSTGTYYVQDIYEGQGLKGIERGTIKKLRVIEIQFRAAGVKSNRNGGPAGGALVSTPVSIDNGTWDVKVVLGDADVYEDGSVCFDVPARTPVYFQALDESGKAVQSMRTWSTLQPGETYSCVGCHETKDETPVIRSQQTMAMKAGAQKLKPFYGAARGFSFNREIQPILDRNCIGCHNDRKLKMGDPPIKTTLADGTEHTAVFSLLDTPNRDENAGRAWSDSYLALTSRGNPDKGPVRWLNVQSIPPLLPPYFAGSSKSPLMKMLGEGHGHTKLLPEELEKIACWIDLLIPFSGDYFDGNCWNEDDLKKYLHYQRKRDEMAMLEGDNIRDFIAPDKTAPALLPLAVESDNPYRNVALNRDDVMGHARSWPHASSNSECRNDPAFAARNAIDGRTENAGHGAQFPSWGPDKRTDLWWKIDFESLVEIDKLVLHIRADFPHDGYWHSATVEFSDGSTQEIEIKKTAEPQEFKFDKRNVSWLRITDLVQTEPLGWCAMTEIEAWGKSVYSPMKYVAAEAP